MIHAVTWLVAIITTNKTIALLRFRLTEPRVKVLSNYIKLGHEK